MSLICVTLVPGDIKPRDSNRGRDRKGGGREGESKRERGRRGGERERERERRGGG